MSAQFIIDPCPNHLHRRGFLIASGAMTAMAFVATGTLSSIAYADALTKAQRDKLTPDDILALMREGNKRFYTGKRENHNFLAQQRASAKGQSRPRCCLPVSPRELRPRRSWTSVSATSSIVAWQAMSKIPISLAVWNSPVNWRGPRWFWSWAIPRAARSRAQLTTPNSATSRACWRKSSPR